eukprot:5222451-Pyramimonas_sp.AAC.1
MDMGFALGEAAGWASQSLSNLGAGLWWSALSVPITIHCAIWWTTDTVEHQGAVGLRGGMYITTHNGKDACSATSALRGGLLQESYFRALLHS